MNTRSQHYARDLRRYYRLPATQVSLTLVLSVVIISVFVVFALRPTLVAIVSLRKTLTESRKTLAQLEAKTSNLERAADQLELIKPELPKLNMSITNTSAGYDPLTTQIEYLAQITGVQLQSETVGPTLLYSRIISPFTPKKGQSVVALPLSIRVTGNYTTVKAFLVQLLAIPRLVGVESAVITKEAGSRGDNVIVSLSINGSAYYLGDANSLNTTLEENRRKR